VAKAVPPAGHSAAEDQVVERLGEFPVHSLGS
jgi:hypothetical protein